MITLTNMYGSLSCILNAIRLNSVRYMQWVADVESNNIAFSQHLALIAWNV